MAKPKLALIPAAQGDKFYSVLPSDGVGDFDFTRNSSATRIAPTGFIQEVAAFGSELITNGDFATDSDWAKGTGVTISGGKANSAGGGGAYASILTQNSVVTTSQNYKISFEVSNFVSGQVVVSIGYNTQLTASANGSYVFNGIAQVGDNTNFIVRNGSSNFVGSIDNVSVIQVIGNKSRLNYDLLNGKVVNCPHYLLEPARTNLVTYSEDFSNAAWTKSNSSITSNSVISPDGTLNADKIIPNATAFVNKYIYIIPTTLNGIDYSLTVFAKEGEYNMLRLEDGNNSQGAWFDLSNGTLGTVGVSVDAKIQNYGNGWYKCSITKPSVSTNVFFVIAVSNTESIQVGDGTSGAYIYGAQLEQGSYPTSYIPTNATAITRAAETANGSGDAATFNSTEGVLMAEIAALANDGTNRFISLTNGVTDATNISLAFTTTTNQIRILVDISYVLQMSLTYTVNSVLDFNKIILKYKENDFALWVNGFEVATDPSGTVPTANYISDLSFQRISSLQFYGKTRELQYFNSVLTDAQLETLTSWTSLQEMITSQLYTNY